MPRKSLPLLLLLLGGPLAHAEAPETIVVTASRIPQELHALGSSVTVIDLDDEQSPARSIADVLRRLPGISISQSGGDGSLTELRMRGGEINHTLVLLDGVELNNPATGQIDFAHLSAIGIERIEILRGAQSALWGSQAISGVINLISRAGGDSSLRLKTGSDGERQAAIRAAASFKRGNINVAWQSARRRGDDLARQNGDEDGYRNRTMQWGLRFAPTDNTSLRLSLRQTRATSDYDAFLFSEGRLEDAPYQSKNRRRYASAQLHGRIGEIRHQWDLRYLQTHDQFFDAFNSPPSQGQRVQASGLLWRVFEACPGHSCTLGGGLEWSRERYTRGEVGPLRFRTDSAFLILKWQPQAYTFLDLSLRKDDNQEFGDARVWRASAAWHWPGQPLRLYLASGIGIANPTLTERFGYFPNTFVGNPDLIPERARSHEFGVEYTPNGACCRVGLNLYTQRLENEIRTIFPPGEASTAINRQKRSRRRGAELELEYRPHPRWAASGSYAWLRATEPGAAGEQTEARRPRHQYQLSLRRQAPSWSAQFDARAVRGLQDGGTALENYRVAHFSLRYSLTPKLQLQLAVNNLFDESYQEIRGYPAPDRSFSLSVEWTVR